MGVFWVSPHEAGASLVLGFLLCLLAPPRPGRYFPHKRRYAWSPLPRLPPMLLPLALCAALSLGSFATPQAPLEILDQSAIAARLEQLEQLIAPLAYEAEVQEVPLALRHVSLLTLREQLEQRLVEMDLEAVERLLTDLFVEASERRPESYRRTLCTVAWSPWRHAVHYRPEWPGQVAFENYVQTEERNASFQPLGKMLRFARGQRHDIGVAVLPELVPYSTPDESWRERLTKVLGWTQRTQADGRRLVQAKDKDQRLEWLLPAEDDRPRAFRDRRNLYIYTYHPKSTRLSQVLMLLRQSGSLKARLVRLTEHQPDPPASQFVLSISTPERISLPSDRPASEITELPAEWKGLVVVSER